MTEWCTTRLTAAIVADRIYPRLWWLRSIKSDLDHDRQGHPGLRTRTPFRSHSLRSKSKPADAVAVPHSNPLLARAGGSPCRV
jgi:hypothetical protein